MPRSTILLTGMIALSVSGLAHTDEPPPKKPVSRVVKGRVVDDHWAPIAGALVMLGPGLDFPGFTEEGTSRTDAEGRYHINLTNAEWAASKLQPMVLATGFAYKKGTIEAGVGKAVADFTLKLEAWKTTEIRLADPSGKPGAGVELTWTLTGNIPLVPDHDRCRRPVPDCDGDRPADPPFGQARGCAADRDGDC